MGSPGIDNRVDVRSARYDAFVSYSHAVDGKLGPVLQNALARFASPWYRARALRVFRDDASLAANPGLWSSIEQALDGAGYLILLASPAAAESKWVGQEVAYWLTHKPPGRLLLVLTEGEIAWDDATGDFEWPRTTALPRSLAGAFASEPRHTDLRWARMQDHLSLSDPRFREAVADLAAPLHGRAKDDLVGEHVRRARLVRGAIGLLAALAVSTAAAGIFAVKQQNTAREESRRAEAQTRVALSRRLAGQALARLETRPDLGFLLALEAFGVRPTPEAREAAGQAVRRSQGMIALLRPFSRAISEVVMSPDGALLAVRSRAEIVVWSIATRRQVATIKQRSLGSIAFSPTSQRLAVPDHNEIRLWEITGSQPHFTSLGRAADTVLALRFSRDGTLLAAGTRDGTVSVWNVAAGTRLAVLGTRVPSGARAVTSVAFSPDQRRLALGQADGTVVTWDLRARALAGVALHAGRAGVSSLVFRPDGRTLIAANRSGEVWIWDQRAGKRLRGGGVRALGVALSPDGRTLAYGDSLGGLRLWDPVTRRSAGPPIVEHGPALQSIAFAADGRTVVSGDRNGTVVLWDTHHGQERRLRDFPGPARSAAFDVARRTLAVAHDRAIGLWDVATRSRIGRPLVGSTSTVLSVAFSNDATLLAAGARDGTIGLWQASSQDFLGTIAAYRAHTTGVAFSPDGRTLASAGDDVGSLPVKLWDVRTRRRSSTPLEHVAGSPTAVQFKPGGRTLAAGDASGAIILWDPITKQPLAPAAPQHGGRIASLAFDRDGATLFSASADDTVRIWDAAHLTPVGQALENLGGAGARLAVSPDGRTLASTGLNWDARGNLSVPEVRLWDVRTSRRLGSPLRLTHHVIALAFGRDGKRLYAAGGGGTLTTWNSELWTHRSRDFRARLCRLLDHSLTRQEWRDFLPEQPYRETCT